MHLHWSVDFTPRKTISFLNFPCQHPISILCHSFYCFVSNTVNATWCRTARRCNVEKRNCSGSASSWRPSAPGGAASSPTSKRPCWPALARALACSPSRWPTTPSWWRAGWTRSLLAFLLQLLVALRSNQGAAGAETETQELGVRFHCVLFPSSSSHPSEYFDYQLVSPLLEFQSPFVLHLILWILCFLLLIPIFLLEVINLPLFAWCEPPTSRISCKDF